MVFEYILKKHGIDPKTDLTIDQSISFGLTAAAFTSGDADYTVEFEPFATTLEMENCGTVVASLGRDSGYVPYTAYCAKKSYMEKNPRLIQKFTNAIQKGLDYVNSHSAWEIAKTIQPQFKDTPVEKIAAIIDRYKSQDTWKEDTIFEKDSFELLENILEESGELKKRYLQTHLPALQCRISSYSLSCFSDDFIIRLLIGFCQEVFAIDFNICCK